MAFTTIAKVREITNLTTSDVSDADMTVLIANATIQVNSDVNISVTRERVWHIDNTRQNEMNSTNTTFYVRNWRKYLADKNRDGSVSTTDITVYQVASDGTETELTISSITHNQGKFVLNTAPSSSVELYLDYEWCSKDQATPSKEIELATSNLTAAFAFQKRDTGMSPQQVYGNVRLMRDMQAKSVFYKEYQRMVDGITSSDLVEYTEAEIF